MTDAVEDAAVKEAQRLMYASRPRSARRLALRIGLGFLREGPMTPGKVDQLCEDARRLYAKLSKVRVNL